MYCNEAEILEKEKKNQWYRKRTRKECPGPSWADLEGVQWLAVKACARPEIFCFFVFFCFVLLSRFVSKSTTVMNFCA